eukprot:6016346-Pyramimonas_sp.AAC.1
MSVSPKENTGTRLAPHRSAIFTNPFRFLPVGSRPHRTSGGQKPPKSHPGIARGSQILAGDPQPSDTYPDRTPDGPKPLHCLHSRKEGDYYYRCLRTTAT